MVRIGYLLITAAFLGGSYLSVLHPLEVSWMPFVVAVLAGFGGVALVRVGSHQEARATDLVESNVAAIERSLTNIVEKVGALNAKKGEIHTYDMHKRLDAELIDDLNAFVEARETISHVYGLQAYADVMSTYAAGERYLNRVWSASADGYIDEVNAYMERALEQFQTTRATMMALHEGGPTG